MSGKALVEGDPSPSGIWEFREKKKKPISICPPGFENIATALAHLLEPFLGQKLCTNIEQQQKRGWSKFMIFYSPKILTDNCSELHKKDKWMLSAKLRLLGAL